MAVDADRLHLQTGHPGLRPRASANGFVQWTFVAFLLLVFVGFEPFRARDFSALGHVVRGDGDTLRQISYLTIFAILAVLFVQQNGLAGYRRFSLSVILVLVWCLLSAMWSLAPDITLRRAGLTTVVVLCVFMATQMIGAQRSLQIVRLLFAAILVVNFVSVFVVPQAVHQYNGLDAANLAGNWRGLFYHKNVAGPVTALSSLLFLHFATRMKKRSDWLLFALSIVFLLGTQAKAAIGLLGISLVAGYLYGLAERSRSGRSLFVGLCITALMGSAIASIVLKDTLIELLADPGLFTGRGAIWQVVLSYVQAHPFLGSGFGAFWQIGSNSPVLKLTDVRWLLFTAQTHNGYLELLVSTGMIGLVLGIVATVWMPMRRLLAFGIEHGTLLFSWMTFGILLNLTETSFFERDSEEWVFYLFGLALLHVGARRRSTTSAP